MRSRVQLVRGTSTALSIIFLPLFAWAILPYTYEIQVGIIKLHSWNFFLALICLPALTTAIIFVFMPESPKFLMTLGKPNEALSIFKNIYRANTGRRHSTFPIRKLAKEKLQNQKGFQAVKPLFQPPYVWKLILVCANTLAILIGSFSLKVWYPQILQSINDFQKYGDKEVYICNIVDSMAHPNSTSNGSNNSTCTVNVNNSAVYINATTQGGIQLVAFIIAGLVINKTGKKGMAIFLSALAGLCPLIMYFVGNSVVMLSLFPTIIAFAEIVNNVNITITMEIFPTTFRTTALNMHLMFSRIGIAVGNVMLPYLLKAGCLPTMLFFSLSIFVSVGLTFLMPNTDNKALQ